MPDGRSGRGGIGTIHEAFDGGPDAEGHPAYVVDVLGEGHVRVVGKCVVVERPRTNLFCQVHAGSAAPSDSVMKATNWRRRKELCRTG